MLSYKLHNFLTYDLTHYIIPIPCMYVRNPLSVYPLSMIIDKAACIPSSALLFSPYCCSLLTDCY